MAKLKIGVFGAGRGMSAVHQIFDHPEAELVAVCDKYKPLLDNCRKQAEAHGLYNIKYYERFDDFFEHDMDAVVCANYAHEHAKFGIRLLRSGRHIMTECLTVANMAEAVELIEAVEETGKVYTYAENYCYTPVRWEMRNIYRSGALGELMYAEGEYLHDCSSIWPSITYGERNHWRNRMHPFFYCTHSLGPLMAMTGLQPVRVTGLRTPVMMQEWTEGLNHGVAAVEMVQMENGALFKSIHGDLKREPASVNYELYGTKGCMETQRFGEWNLNVWKESDKACQGTLETYMPEKFVEKEMASQESGHGGSDFYATHFFIQKILGRPQGEWAIDVYKAVSMGICGILAYRSCLQGGVPVDVPDLRDPA